MRSLPSSLLAALGASSLAASVVAALHLPTPGALRQSPLASAVPRPHALYRGRNSDRPRHTLVFEAHRPGREDDPSESSGQQREDADDDISDDDADDEGVNADDFIDFEEMDRKMGRKFFDVGTYGPIRSLASPDEITNPIDPLSAEDIELWTQRRNAQRNRRQHKKLRRRLSWLSPVASLLLPRRQSPSSDARVPAPKVLRSLPTPKQFLRNRVDSLRTLPDQPRNLLVALNVCAFAYQIVAAVRYLPGFNRVLAATGGGAAWSRRDVVVRALGLAGGGASVVIANGAGRIAAHSMGPFFLDWAHQPFHYSILQKHRYLSCGFLHGSLFHLGMNVRALLSLPSWLETGLGKGLYASAYLVGIVAGSVAHSLSTVGSRAAAALCVGASGGICGLYGLMFAALLRMGNADAVSYLLKSMVWLLAFGFLIPNVSNAGHVGGFLGGWLVGFLFGPGYERSYALERAEGIARDTADVEFRGMMGPGIYPSAEGAIFPLTYLWIGVGVTLLSRPELRRIPGFLLRSAMEPGSASGVRALLRYKCEQ